MQTAYVVNGVVVELPTPVTGFTLQQCYAPAYLADCVSAPDNVAVGWTYDGTSFSAPSLPPPINKAQLNDYANAKQWNLATGGYTVTIDGAGITFPTDVVSMGLITGKAARLAQPNPPASFIWQTPTGFVTIAAADFISVATQIADFVQATFDDLEPVEASIASGSITTTAAVDSAAWPSNVSAAAG